jgi:tyrosine-protein kinase Etk/Wzc
MELEKYNFSVEESQENNLKDILIKYFYNWKWFVLSIIVSMVAGYYYFRAQTPMYEVSATILIKDDKKGDLSEISAFTDLEIFKKNNNIDNEIEILKSRSLMIRMVEQLKLNVTYFLKERPRESEVFSTSPLHLEYATTDPGNAEVWGEWVIIPRSAGRFKVLTAEGEEKGEFDFGSPMPVDFGTVTITPTSHFNNWYFGKEIIIRLSPIVVAADIYRNAVQVNPAGKNSSVLVLTLRAPLIDKASAVLNNLIEQHNADAIADKNVVSKNTADFINERIKFITSELSDVEGEAEEFKTRHKLVDVESEAKLFLESGSASELSIVEAGTQLKLAEYMYDDLARRSNPSDLIPSNLGLQDPAIGAMIADYNKLVLERNRILKNSSEKNPVIESLNAQLAGLRSSLKESLENLKAALAIKMKELSRQEGGINSKIAAVPKYEREYRIIQRQQQIKEALYLYLLQKREETNIALAVTVANAKVIDKAYSSGGKVAPQKQVIYLAAFLIGLLLPVVVLFVLELMNTKVHSKKDIDRVNIPFLGDIPLSSFKERLVVTANNRSNIAEAFRLLRTNLEFITASKNGMSKTVFVTSTIGKEGKSFIALNLAASFALSGKKVLLVGTDLRAPKILAYLNLPEKTGLTNYLSNGDIKLEEIIFPAPGFTDFDILPSGPIPPNPAELLMHPRIKELFDTITGKYDYVIVDTAPVGLVADTLLLSNYADCTVFVARANYLDKRLLRIAESLNKDKRLPNMAVLINGSDYKGGYGYAYGYGYGYGYGGYGYGQEGKGKTPLWKRIFQ